MRHCNQLMDACTKKCTYNNNLYVIYYYCRKCGYEDWEYSR